MKQVQIIVLGKKYDVLLDERIDTIYNRKGARGKPSDKLPREQIQTKTLKKLILLYYVLTEAKLNPLCTATSVLVDIAQDFLKCNRFTARDYVKTIITIQTWSKIPHDPTIVIP